MKRRLQRQPARPIWLSRPTLIASAIVCALGSPAWAGDYFDPDFLSALGGGKNVDLSVFAEPGGVVEGNYPVSIYMNDTLVGEHTVHFEKNAHGRVEPLLTPEFLDELGVNVPQVDDLKNLPADTPITDLSALIPQASTKLNMTQLRLDISVPQIAMKPNFVNWSDPSLWEDGITALVSNYSLSAGQTKNTQSHGPSSRNTNLYTNLRSRLTLGAWRLHSSYSYSYSDNNHGDSQSTQRFDNTYLSRIIVPLRATLTAGETYSGGDIFDSVPFRGVRLQSNDEMLPDQLRGFAPAITGIANSNARITVRQNGHITYETYVAPGPFSINDLTPSGLAGDYEVTITEADGAERQFVVPYSSLPMMLRPGGWNYDVVAGRYDGGYTQGSKQDPFTLLSGAYGLPQNITLYSGALISSDYRSFVLGSGISLGQIGALSADITTSDANFEQGEKKTGQSYRIRYSKSMLTTGTTVDLTALRYASEHYYSFSEFNSQGYRLRDDVNPWILERRRSSFQTSITQSMGDWGTLNLRASRDDYWHSDKTRTNLSAGYNNNFNQITYGVYYNIDQTKGGNNSWPENRQVSFNLSVPFTVFSQDPMNNSTMYSTASITHDNHGRTQNNVGVSGSLPGNAWSYSLSQGWGNQGQESNSNANLGYQGSKGNINTGYSYSSHTQTANVNLNGGLLVHRGGVALARTMGDAVAIVHAPGAEGVSLSSGNGVTDRWGYAVAPYLSNFKRNNIGLNPTTLPDGVDITQSNVNVYPTPGAVVKVKFATRIGHQVLMNLTTSQGIVPFGAIATLVNTDNDDGAPQETLSSIVGDAGQVYLTGLPETGTLTVKWGNQPDQQCVADFDLSHLKGQASTGLAQATVPCRSSGSTTAGQTAPDKPAQPAVTSTVLTAPVLTPASAEASAPKTRWLLK